MRNTNLHIIQQLKQQPKQSKKEKPSTGLIGDVTNFINEFLGDDNSTIASLLKIQNVIGDVGKAVANLAKQTNQLEEANKSLQDQFGLNIKDSTKMGAELDQLGKQFQVGGGKLRKYIGDLKGLIGGYAGAFSQTGTKMNKQIETMLRTQTIIQNQLKLSGDVANKFTLYSTNIGRDSDSLIANYAAMAEQITKTTGYQVSAKELIADTAGLSEDLLMLYGKMPGKLAMATVKAKALGVTMSQLNSIGNNLLNIESSIGQELEYQLLSGRRLIGNEQASAELKGKSLTNAYREAQLQGDGPKQAEILNQILKQEGKTLEDNLFARKQMAEMLGMDEAALARSLMKQKVLNELAAKGVTSLDTKSIMDSKLTDEEKEKYLKQLQEVGDTRTTDEKMADDIESIVTDGIKVLTEPEKIAEAAAARSQRLRDKGIEVPAQALEDLKNKDVTALGKAVTKDQASGQLNTITGAFVDALTSTSLKSPWTIQTTGNVSIEGETTGVNDVAFGPGPGRVIMGPEGAFSLDNKDSIIAGTNLSGGSSSDMSTFAAAIVNAINRQTDALTSNNTMNAPYWS